MYTVSPIRVRAWSKVMKLMFPAADMKAWLTQIASMAEERAALDAWSEKNIIFMLPTGMIDKSDKEIFDGDIVRFTYDTKFGKVVDYGVISFSKKYFQWGVDKETLLDIGMHLESKERPEVVGNIWENPELIPKS